jgi:hypothetical protein
LSIIHFDGMVFSPFLHIWRDLFLGVSLAFVVIHNGAGGRGEVDALEKECWSEGGGSIVIPDFVDGMRWILVQDNTGTSLVDVPQRHVPRCLQQACPSTHRASLVMVLSLIWQWWRPGISSNAHLASVENPRDCFVFYPL